ncbi:forkhead box protein K1-like isoform X3 [Amphibalanus amphitrite]|uniref:forkhead box protein K1-like isoform X3 n=1 Tax=Amphibalanus amphitrite TaxID=1232801 RepID=UPI001C91F8A0|nr:forkhead box protein K1-like isoform X3 [Amphibalanus amphitrite]
MLLSKLLSKPSATTAVQVTDMSQPQEGPVLAKIEWNDKEYLMRQKRITLGRHSSKGDVDVDLGDSSFISRVHLEIIFKEPDFFMKCHSKNGVFVDDDFQRPSDGLQIIPSRCMIGFPSTGMFMVFVSQVNISVDTDPSFQQAIATGPATSPTDIVSTSSSRAVSPSQLGDVIILEESSGEPTTPLLHHSYSSDSRGAAQERRGDAAGEHRPQDRRSKPPYSYAQLIVQALSTSKDGQLTLSGIYSYITRHYPYYRTADKGWQNSIRHNLSLNRSFTKVARSHEHQGKGGFWRVKPQAEGTLVEQAFRRRGRGAANGSGARNGNGVGSDASPDSPMVLGGDGASPPYLQSRESSPAAVAPVQFQQMTQQWRTTPGVAEQNGEQKNGVLGVQPHNASAGSLVTSPVSEDDVIIEPADLISSDECPVVPEHSEPDTLTRGPSGDNGVPQRAQTAERC